MILYVVLNWIPGYFLLFFLSECCHTLLFPPILFNTLFSHAQNACFYSRLSGEFHSESRTVDDSIERHGVVNLQSQVFCLSFPANSEADARWQGGGGSILGPGVHDVSSLAHAVMPAFPGKTNLMRKIVMRKIN